MSSTQLFPKPPKQMKQPRKDVLRTQLVVAAQEIERLRGIELHLQERISNASQALAGDLHAISA